MLVLYNQIKLNHYNTRVRIKAADNLDTLSDGDFFTDNYFSATRRAAIALLTAMRKNRLEVRRHIARNFVNDSFASSNAYRSSVQREAVEVLSEIGNEHDVKAAVDVLFQNCWISLQVYPSVCNMLSKHVQNVESKLLSSVLESKDSILSQSEHGTTTRSMNFNIKPLKTIAKNELNRRKASSGDIDKENDKTMTSGSLSLVWPPTNILPDSPIMWLRNSNGEVFSLNLEQDSILLIFLTVEAAQVVSIALNNVFNITSEIRSMKGASRSVFENILFQSDEFKNFEVDLKIVWEDDPIFKSLLQSLEINIVEK